MDSARPSRSAPRVSTMVTASAVRYSLRPSSAAASAVARSLAIRALRASLIRSAFCRNWRITDAPGAVAALNTQLSRTFW
nr:hypothetical protein GCM10020092_063330 [Actinoplanes digitatis]